MMIQDYATKFSPTQNCRVCVLNQFFSSTCGKVKSKLINFGKLSCWLNYIKLVDELKGWKGVKREGVEWVDLLF